MSSIEHMMENALVSIEGGLTFEEFTNSAATKDNIKGIKPHLKTNKDIAELFWAAAIYVKYTYIPCMEEEYDS